MCFYMSRRPPGYTRTVPPFPSAPLFRSGPLRRDLLLKRILRPAATAAGLPAGLRVHDLRHTSVSLLIELGAHPKVIQERLGHSSITVRSEEHKSELQSLMRISYAVFCLKNKSQQHIVY